MNIYDFKTKQDLDNWAEQCLVITEDITPSPITGYNRAIILLKFNAEFIYKQIVINVAVFELDVNGNPIVSKSLIPYEEIILANNNQEIDLETLKLVAKEDQDPNKYYMGEYDAYVYITKNNPVLIWNLFKTAIKNSSKFK